MALQKMGSSVFHGGFSTFIAIVVVSPSKSYIFIVFFRLWFSIILFGMANGFMLLTMILAFIGPTYTITDPSHTEEDDKPPKKEPEERFSTAAETPTPALTSSVVRGTAAINDEPREEKRVTEGGDDADIQSEECGTSRPR